MKKNHSQNNQQEFILSKLESQHILFSPTLNRVELQNVVIKNEELTEISINVWRNHGFEPLVPLLGSFFSFCGYHAEYNLSGYDDSLSFSNHKTSNLELIWLDSSRYLDKISSDDLLSWLSGRINALREISEAPIILATWSIDLQLKDKFSVICDNTNGIYFADLGSFCAEQGITLIDHRTQAFSGTPISPRAQLYLSRKLACHWIGGLLFPPIKALVLDLDNTLHDGILGEDNPTGLVISGEHKLLQNFLKSQGQKGIFLSLASRNVASDVEEMFNTRKDYVLRPDDFLFSEVSWKDKSKSILNILRNLRISADSIIFVDDNIGELINVSSAFPEINLVYAGTGPVTTRFSIEFFPGLWSWNKTAENSKRIKDLKANQDRQILAKKSQNNDDYLKNLNVRLSTFSNSKNLIPRLAELSNKTNQFNVSFNRFNTSDLSKLSEGEDSEVIGVNLTDRFSDSGIVALIVLKKEKDTLFVLELCISCRAMGRELESAMIFGAIGASKLVNECSSIRFDFVTGPRNQPALDWLKANTSETTATDSSYFHVNVDFIHKIEKPIYLKISHH